MAFYFASSRCKLQCVIWWCLQICRGHCGVSMGPHSRCVCRFVFGFWRCCFFSWTLQRNCCWVPCVCIDVFETMRSKLHSLCVSGSWAWLARCRHSCNSSHSFFVLPCVCCRCGLCRPSWKLPGWEFPEAMMGRRESSERYLPKIIIEKNQKIDSIGNRKKTKNIGTVLGFAILAPLEKSSNSIDNFNIFSNIKKKIARVPPYFLLFFL